MHDIEPFYKWEYIYNAKMDKKNPFHRRKHNNIEYNESIYNYYIHPSWDSFGSETLYIKILYIHYELGFAIIEMLGEWNDAIENDIASLKRNIIDHLINEKIGKFIFITENVFNFHAGDKDYYNEWIEDIDTLEGWIIYLNMPIATQHDFCLIHLHKSIVLYNMENWRTFKPIDIYQQLMLMIKKLLP